MASSGLSSNLRQRILATLNVANNTGAELVTQLLSEAQKVIAAGIDPRLAVQELYIELMIQRGLNPQAARNSWVSASGNSFEAMVRNALNEKLTSQGIRAEKVSGLSPYPDHARIRGFLMLPARRRCVQASFDALPDNDILLLTRARSTTPACDDQLMVFAILSCKTSFRERATQSCFWALATRDTGLRMGLVTQDRDIELGQCQQPTKTRMLLEAYFDRVFSTNPRTSLCGQIRPYDEIFEDVLRWRRDVAPTFISDPWPL